MVTLGHAFEHGPGDVDHPVGIVGPEAHGMQDRLDQVDQPGQKATALGRLAGHAAFAQLVLERALQQALDRIARDERSDVGGVGPGGGEFLGHGG